MEGHHLRNGLLLPRHRRGLFEAATSESALIGIKKVTIASLLPGCANGAFMTRKRLVRCLS
jgi:hypothetical protein